MIYETENPTITSSYESPYPDYYCLVEVKQFGDFEIDQLICVLAYADTDKELRSHAFLKGYFNLTPGWATYYITKPGEPLMMMRGELL